MRAVLELVLHSGALSVPAIARAQGVSRQHVQVQVDALVAADLVAPQPNPAHKRSPLIALTAQGRAMIENMRAEELRAFARLQTGVSDEALAEAAQVLAACRAALVSLRS
jgi:DNA-binding MarR family transcriptional regulator